jgi:regulator of sigma D
MSDMQQFLDEFFNRNIKGRADREWTPSLHARQDVVDAYPKIAGIGVTVDKYMEERAIELRTETGKTMVSYSGLALPEAH